MKNNIFYLLRKLVTVDFRLKYRNSTLGYLWSLLNPLLTFGILYLVFSIFVRIDKIEHYQLYLLLGIFIWSSYVEITSYGMSAIANKAEIISSTNINRYYFVLASCLTNMLNFFIKLLIFFVFLYLQIPLPFNLLLVSGYLILLFFVLSLGIALFLSAYVIKYRDIEHLWNVLITFWFWLTPIFYSINTVPLKFRYLIFHFNPMSRLIYHFRELYIYHNIFTLKSIAYTSLICFGVFMIGYYLFAKRAPYFAEEL